MRTATECTTATATFEVSPVVVEAVGPPAVRRDDWKEVRGLDLRGANELLACLRAAGCKRRQFAISGRDGTYVVRWV